MRAILGYISKIDGYKNLGGKGLIKGLIQLNDDKGRMYQVVFMIYRPYSEAFVQC